MFIFLKNSLIKNLNLLLFLVPLQLKLKRFNKNIPLNTSYNSIKLLLILKYSIIFNGQIFS